MSDIELYSYDACPYAQRTRMVLAEKGLDFALHEVDVYNKPANWATISPYGKVPVLRHDGASIYESTIVNQYLDEAFPDPPLMPASALGRAQARIWMDYCETRFLPASHNLLWQRGRAKKAPRESHQALRHPALYRNRSPGQARRRTLLVWCVTEPGGFPVPAICRAIRRCRSTGRIRMAGRLPAPAPVVRRHVRARKRAADTSTAGVSPGAAPQARRAHQAEPRGGRLSVAAAAPAAPAANLEALREFCARHPRLLILTGAGCSTASGIPEYRDDEGDWKHPQPVQYQDFVGSAAVRQRYWARSAVGWRRMSARPAKYRPSRPGRTRAGRSAQPAGDPERRRSARGRGLEASHSTCTAGWTRSAVSIAKRRCPATGSRPNWRPRTLAGRPAPGPRPTATRNWPVWTLRIFGYPPASFAADA